VQAAMPLPVLLFKPPHRTIPEALPYKIHSSSPL
jgi:hypothetical protein